jgi:hypothetical protein
MRKAKLDVAGQNVRRLVPLDGQMMRESTQGPQDTFLRADPDANRPSLPLVT